MPESVRASRAPDGVRVEAIQRLGGRQPGRDRAEFVAVQETAVTSPRARNADEDVIEMFLRGFRVVDVTRRVARETVTIRRSRRARRCDGVGLGRRGAECPPR